MPTFIVTGNYSTAAVKGMLDRPNDRGAAAAALAEAAGGKMDAYYATTGAKDFLMICTVDDVTGLIAGLMVAGGAGAITHIETQRAFSSAEFTAMQEKAAGLRSSYTPPN